MRIGRLGLFFVVAAVAFACASRERRLSVLLVTLDTTRADHLGCYGGDRARTPHFDALAASGARFENALAQAAITPASHASILSGLDPHHHGARVIYAASGYRLNPGIPTLATVLREHGLATGAFLSSFTVSDFYGFERGFDTFDTGLDHPTDEVMRCADGYCKFDLGSNQRRSDATTDRAIAWLRDQTGPTFLWVHYWDPHDPNLLPPEKILARHPVPPSADPLDERRAVYAAEVEYVDQQFGRLHSALRELERDEDTVIVVVSDHGEGLGDHGHGGHRLLYQEQIRVPLIVRVPGGPTGVVTPLVRTIDIYPTVLAVLGVTAPGRVDGQSFEGLMAGRTETARVAYSEALVRFDLNATLFLKKRPNDDLLYALTELPWKLVYRPSRPEQSDLFHLGEDPREEVSRLATEDAVARRLIARLEGMDAFRSEPFGPPNDAEALERLRSLGYVE